MAAQWQNQTLPPQQVLIPSVTHNALAPWPLTASRACRRLYYLEETRQNDIPDTHVQSQYSECKTPSFYYKKNNIK